MTQETTALLWKEMRRGKSAAAHRIDRLLLLFFAFFIPWLFISRLTKNAVFSVLPAALLSILLASLLHLAEERRKERYVDRRTEQAREALCKEAVCLLSEEKLRTLLPPRYADEDFTLLRCAWDEPLTKNDLLQLNGHAGPLIVTAPCSPTLRQFAERMGYSPVLDLNDLDLSKAPCPTEDEICAYLTAETASPPKKGQTIRARFFVRARWKHCLFSGVFLFFASFFSPIALWYRLLAAVCFALCIACLCGEKE